MPDTGVLIVPRAKHEILKDILDADRAMQDAWESSPAEYGSLVHGLMARRTALNEELKAALREADHPLARDLEIVAWTLGIVLVVNCCIGFVLR